MFYSIKNCYFKLLLSVILLSISITCIAQGAKKTKDTSVAKILVAARNYGDSIVVRWAPGNAVLWMHSNNKGYLFKRIVLKTNLLLHICKSLVPVRGIRIAHIYTIKHETNEEA